VPLNSALRDFVFDVFGVLFLELDSLLGVLGLPLVFYKCCF
jgi:hypothetical protein